MLINSLVDQPFQLSLLFLRPLGIFVIFPLLSSRSLGGSLIRNGVIIACLLPVIPLLQQPDSPFQVYQDSVGIGFVAQEILTGMLIGFVAAIPFWALDSAGYLIDTIRGSSLSSVINPALGEAASVFGILFTQLYMTLFFINDGFSLLMGTLYDSYRLLPPGHDITLDKAWLDILLQQWTLLTGLAVSFALPSMVIMLLVDMALGLINRSAQQLNVFFLAMPVKSILVVFILIISIASSMGVVMDGQSEIFQNLHIMLKVMHHE